MNYCVGNGADCRINLWVIVSQLRIILDNNHSYNLNESLCGYNGLFLSQHSVLNEHLQI